MIASLAGRLLEKHPPVLVMDVQGVGYELEASLSTFARLPAIGEEVRLLTHLVVREDAHLLFGFATRTERHLFRSLLKVNGVGARLALAILSGMSVEEFASCVAQNDVKALVRVPGIGRKTAERLCVELRDQFEAGGGTGLLSPSAPAEDDPRAQATTALVALGFRADEAKRLVEAVAKEGESVEQTIRSALRSARR